MSYSETLADNRIEFGSNPRSEVVRLRLPFFSKGSFSKSIAVGCWVAVKPAITNQ